MGPSRAQAPRTGVRRLTGRRRGALAGRVSAGAASATSATSTSSTSTVTANGTVTTAGPTGSTQVTTVNSPAGSSQTTTVTTVNGTNQYAIVNSTTATLSDRQTVRDIERLFGRVFRNGGSSLIDSKTASDLFVTAGATDQASRDRALSQVADIAVEVLISTRTIQVASVSGDSVVTAPDIQTTAIRLRDSAIIGQASATDVLGRHPELARRFGPPDIIEATALALIEDMLTGK